MDSETVALILTQLEYLLRLVIAAVCGALIGFERKNRLKEAGIRTHLIVSLASALMMLISKYGFYDVVIYDSINLDPSRVAAGIVTGVGFLGAGMIFVRRQGVSGLTTAAGIWATVGVGMAIGGGMYVIGIASTLLIILVQVLLHKDLRWMKIPVAEQIYIELDDSSVETVDALREILREHGIQVLGVKAKRHKSGAIDMEFTAKFPEAYDVADIMNLFSDAAHVRTIEV
ncbi:MAG: MgtC/SapB family protein [Clostridiales bacterium]|uniref:Mg2+ transporter-C (MgtC) family protein n=1 Tax=Harryflintia acetispora TaxID=1849041 RepID=A0A9X8UJY7_9FIRM|nr:MULTISPECIES: MgtC/SapB family protein [Oscillospiraceae]PWM39336.1 MAG: MgtC/SapB family protein [Clostridiales bacterium]RGB67533.1 MgtC/SapB family protein [Harryflintia acetispora]TCL43998.1 putative Mg2+ transporter-C (MgtC) family protein [Harryflintia acetispora]